MILGNKRMHLFVLKWIFFSPFVRNYRNCFYAQFNFHQSNSLHIFFKTLFFKTMKEIIPFRSFYVYYSSITILKPSIFVQRLRYGWLTVAMPGFHPMHGFSNVQHLCLFLLITWFHPLRGLKSVNDFFFNFFSFFPNLVLFGL